MNKYVSKDVVATAINAWREFRNVPNACQRDYIYYGINKTNTPGSLNRNIREKLYRFRISATAFGRIADADGDQRLQDLTQTKRYFQMKKFFKIYGQMEISNSDSSPILQEKQIKMRWNICSHFP